MMPITPQQQRYSIFYLTYLTTAHTKLLQSNISIFCFFAHKKDVARAENLDVLI